MGEALADYAAIGEVAASARVRALGQRFAEAVSIELAAWRPQFCGAGGFASAPAVSPGGAVVARFPREVDPYPFYRALDAAGLHAKCIKSTVHNQLRWGVPWWETEARVDAAASLVRSNAALLEPRP